MSDTPRHPRGLMTLFFTEMWERFSYYGMRALLVLYMVDAVAKGGMGLDDKTATAIYGLYTAVVYLMSLPGGWLGDRLLGARRSVWYAAMIIALLSISFPSSSFPSPPFPSVLFSFSSFTISPFSSSSSSSSSSHLILHCHAELL